MSTLQPFFFAGARAKILLDNRTVAFCTNVEYKITVEHAEPRVCGRYEVEEIVPLSYIVHGTFNIIRYARGLSDVIEEPPIGVSPKGNGIGTYSPPPSNIVSSAFENSPLFPGGANQSFNPSTFFRSRHFDFEIRQKIEGGETVIARIRDCRIVEGAFALTKGDVARQSFTFKGRYADDDTYIASKSGVGQEFS